MQTLLSRFQNAARWLVPLAAVLAIAAWFYVSPEGALGKLDAIGYAVCHRIAERSFQVDGRALPLCARCTGEFNAAAIGLIFQGIVSGRRNRMPSRGIFAVLFLFFLAFGIDGTNSYIYLLKQSAPGTLEQIPTLYIPNNVLRLMTGSGMGLAVAAVLFPTLNQTFWKQSEDRPALEWKSFGGLVALVLLINLGVLTDSPWVLYPVGAMSALGTLSLLTIVFTIIWTILMRQENMFDHPRQLWLGALAGLTLALLMIVSIDFLRFQFTGTWSGFPGVG